MALVLYGRPGCHLCEDMEHALAPLARAAGFALRVENVDSNPDWRAAYGLRIPVLALEGHVICEGRLDEDAVRDALRLR